MNTIVVGVDNSPQAREAAQRAAELAKALGAALHIVTATTKNELHKFGISSDQTVLSDNDMAEESLNAIAQAFRTSIEVSVRAVRSSPAEALCSEAERLNASMIVVGNKRTQGVGRVLGSVAGAVARDAPCDVYIVHTYG
jgi:nucleotide-binding universal stress UspA family protein